LAAVMKPPPNSGLIITMQQPNSFLRGFFYIDDACTKQKADKHVFYAHT